MVPMFSRSSALLPLLLLLGGAWLGGCGSEEPSRPGVAIRSFEVEPGHLEEAGNVTIRWSTTGAAALELLHGDQEVDLGGLEADEGSLVVQVSESTTFTLTASDAAGASVSASRDEDFASTFVSGHFKRAMRFNGRSFLFQPK